MKQKGSVSMQIENPNAAGIDVGSRSHFVAIGQGSKDVREYGVYNEDLESLCLWLQENKVKTIAMESTGTYWQNLFSVLQSAGFEVLLCNGKFTKNIKGKKTDVLDCQWIQKLHTLGLLNTSFLPDLESEKLRTLCRHRTNLLESSSIATNKLQKYLRLLNLRLDVVVNDITGLSGILIIDAICKGETNAEVLASHRHGNCKKSEEEIAKALQSNNREDYLFALQQEFFHYQFLQNQLSDCDAQIKTMFENIINNDNNKREHFIEKKVHKKVNKNSPKNFDLNLYAYQYYEGIDLLAIEGVSYSTVLTLISELGTGINKFETSKQFTSWLRLSPNNKISGGKVLSARLPKGSNRLKIALRNAANAIGNLNGTSLSNFFKRISHRKGRISAISATARKLAVIIWNMLSKKTQYLPQEAYSFVDQKRKKITQLKKLITKFDIKPEDFNLSNA